MATKQTNLEYWKNEIADMPEFCTNLKVWWDRETGDIFKPEFDYRPNNKNSRRSVSDKTKASREAAKSFGGKALKGTSRQVAWAEDIRAEKIRAMSANDATECCRPTGLMITAKFWIENRDKAPKEFTDFANRANTLRDEYTRCVLVNDADKARVLANEYNALTAKWGF